MKKTIITVIFVSILATSAFGQTTADEWLEKAAEHLISGNWNNAITACNEVINRDRSNLDAFWYRGLAYSYTGNYETSITDFNIVVNGAPDFPGVYMQRGFSYGGLGMFHKAIKDYRTALEKGYDPTGGNWSVNNSPNVTSSMWLLGLVHMEIVINRFLGNTNNVTRYENLLRTLCIDTNVTRAEVETFYRNGILGLVSQIVDEEFNKVSFMIDRNYNAILTRNPQNGHYILWYEGVRNVTKELTSQTLELLSSAMSRSGDFSNTAFDTVRAQAQLIPAVSNIGRQTTEPTVLLTNILTGLYTAETTAQREHFYRALIGLHIRYQQIINTGESARAAPATRSLIRALVELSPELSSRFGSDIRNIDYFAVRFTSTSRDEIEVLASWR